MACESCRGRRDGRRDGGQGRHRADSGARPVAGTNARLAARYWGLSVPDYIERADGWRLDRSNGNLLPWLLFESPLRVANVREIARQLSERNIGAVLFAGFETGRDMLSMHGGSLETVAQATNTVLDAGQEFGLPVAMTSTTNMMERIEQGARLFTGGVAPALRRERGVRRPARSAGQRPAACPARCCRS